MLKPWQARLCAKQGLPGARRRDNTQQPHPSAGGVGACLAPCLILGAAGEGPAGKGGSEQAGLRRAGLVCSISASLFWRRPYGRSDAARSGEAALEASQMAGGRGEPAVAAAAGARAGAWSTVCRKAGACQGGSRELWACLAQLLSAGKLQLSKQTRISRGRGRLQLNLLWEQAHVAASPSAEKWHGRRVGPRRSHRQGCISRPGLLPTSRAGCRGCPDALGAPGGCAVGGLRPDRGLWLHVSAWMQSCWCWKPSGS